MSIFSKLTGLGLNASQSRSPDADHSGGSPRSSDAATAALMIACPDPTEEDSARDQHRLRGQFLARQDRWKQLSAEIRAADISRELTPGGMPAADLLAYGARSDVILAAEHALVGGKPEKNTPLLQGIEALEEMLSEVPHDPMRAIIVALAHMDMGWAWRGTGPTSKVPTRNFEAFEAHFDRAYDILSEFTKECHESPLFMTARCTLNGAGLTQHGQISRDFERLIDLQPGNPAAMRALGTYMSPRWFGSYEDLELEARRTAARTYRQWGSGGYAWVMFDAVPGDTRALTNLDLEFFIEGLDDILKRMPDQHSINLVAAFCAHMGEYTKTGVYAADRAAATISDCAQWVVRSHMTELHPMIWAHAAAGFANNLHVPSTRRFAAMGQRDGLRFIADLFQREIQQGRRIIFTADGPVAENT